MTARTTGERDMIERLGITRRRALQGAGAAAGAIGAPWIGARAADTLVVHAYGGEYQEVFVKTTVEPFEKKFGVKVTYDQGGTASETYAKIRAGRGTPGFDVAAELTEPEVILGAKENLLEKITEQEVPNLKHVWKKSRELVPPNAVVDYYQYLALIWNKDKLEKPDSWLDYWDPGKRYGDKVKGFVINYNPANLLSVYALIMAAKVGADAEEYAKAVPGCHYLTLAEAKTAYKKGTGLDSIYGSMTVGNKFNLDNKVYKATQKPESYLAPSVVEAMK